VPKWILGTCETKQESTYKRNIEARSGRPNIVAVQKEKVLLIVSR